jgi:hypothetical protein
LHREACSELSCYVVHSGRRKQSPARALNVTAKFPSQFELPFKPTADVRASLCSRQPLLLAAIRHSAPSPALDLPLSLAATTKRPTTVYSRTATADHVSMILHAGTHFFGCPLDDYPSANRLIGHRIPLDARAETLAIVGSMRTLLSIRRNGNRSANDPRPRVRLGKPNRTTQS